MENDLINFDSLSLTSFENEGLLGSDEKYILDTAHGSLVLSNSIDSVNGVLTFTSCLKDILQKP